MSKGQFALTKTPCEWGSKARKEEDRERGLRARARRDWIEDSLLGLDDGLGDIYAGTDTTEGYDD